MRKGEKYILLDEKCKIQAYKQSLKSAWGYNDYNDWPVKFNSVMHLFLEEFAQEVLDDLEEIRAQGIPPQAVARAFFNPARIYRLINPVLFGMKKLGRSLKQQREITVCLLDLVKQLKYGSEFNEDGINIILGPKELDAVRREIPFTRADENSSALLQRFCGVMWSYTEAIFFRAHDVTKEIHGPYYVSGSLHNLLIREYMNLNPSRMWRDIPLLPFQSISVYAEYSPDLELSIDSYNHLFLRNGNYKNDLISYAIRCGDELLDINALPKIINMMIETIKHVHQWADRSSWHEITRRYADIYWYRKKPLRDILGLDWTVPEAVYEKIDHGEKDPRRKENLTAEQIDRLIQMIV
jgi:hypothetical protein